MITVECDLTDGWAAVYLDEADTSVSGSSGSSSSSGGGGGRIEGLESECHYRFESADIRGKPGNSILHQY